MIVTGYKKCRTAPERKLFLKKLTDSGFFWANGSSLFPEPDYIYDQIIIAFDASRKKVWYGSIDSNNGLTVNPNLV